MRKFDLMRNGGSLKSLAGLVMLAWAPWVWGGQISQFDIKTTGDVARLSLEAPVGVMRNVAVSGRGEALQLLLKGADKADVLAYLDKLKSSSLFKTARLLPSEGDELRVLIEFSQVVAILDETVLALPGKVSRWEVVLGIGEAALAKAAAKAVAPSLAQIDAMPREGRVDITLTGNMGLLAEASFLDAPHRLVVDLPGVSHEQAAAVAARYFGEAGLIKNVKALKGPKDAARIEFELTEAADLIDTLGYSENDKGQVVLSLVPDAVIVQGKAGRLEALGFEVSEGLMQMRLVGVSGSRINAYTIEEPARLVVDFLGWTPAQVKEALAKFGDKSIATLGQPRLDVTRLGSARAVFDLAVSAPFQRARPIRLPVEGGVDAYADNLLITLAPNAASTQTLVRRSPLDLRFRRELHDGRLSEVIVRAPILDNAERYAEAALRPQPERNFALMSLLGKAMETDAKYLAAKSEFNAISEVKPQARAGLLPSAAFEYQRSSVKQDILRAAHPTFPSGATNYGSNNLLLTITQPLFKPQAWIKLDQADLVINQAQLNVVAAEQDLILRVSTAYLNLLAANDGVDLARAERQATEKQHEEAKLRLERGLGTISQMQDTEARLSLTRAREIEAANRVDDARLAIKEMVGENVAAVNGFKGDFEASMPLPSAVESWVEASLEQNLALQGRNIAIEITALEVRRQRAGHLPTLALTGSISRQGADGSIYGDGQKSSNAEVGVKFILPITDGGLTLSMTREAVARKEKAEHEREQEYRRTERIARSSFNGVVTSAKTLAALRQSVAAQESALETRLEGYKSGIYNVLSVMDAYRLYYAAQRDYLQARYDYLINRLKLKQAVGTLTRTDLEDISALMSN